jgi:hypothetical protein
MEQDAGLVPAVPGLVLKTPHKTRTCARSGTEQKHLYRSVDDLIHETALGCSHFPNKRVTRGMNT